MFDANKHFTLIGGIDGAGKSSLLGILTSQRTDLGSIVDLDQTVATFDGDRNIAKKALTARIYECLANGVNFTQETTLSGSYPRKVAKRAKAAGYTVRLFYVGIDSMEDSIIRIENRVRRGGHDIPREDIIRRYENRFSSLKSILPYCDEAIFFDNNNGFTQVAQYLNGELILLGERKPKWLSEIQEALK